MNKRSLSGTSSKDASILQVQQLSNGGVGRRATARIALRILREYKRQFQITKPPYNPQDAATFCGIDVHTTDAISISSGRLLPSENKVSILLNRSEKYYRRRFTCAHELGHAIIRGYLKSASQLALLSPRNTEEEEIRASIFASNFLMPENDLIRALKSQEPSNHAETVAINLSRMFAVNLFAIVYRLTDFELPTRQWLFLILKYMAHPAKARPGAKGRDPKLRIIKSANADNIYIPWDQGADSVGLSIGNLALEQALVLGKSKSTHEHEERIQIKLINDEGIYKDAEAYCQTTYRTSSSKAAGPVILAFLTIKDIRFRDNQPT